MRSCNCKHIAQLVQMMDVIDCDQSFGPISVMCASVAVAINNQPVWKTEDTDCKVILVWCTAVETSYCQSVSKKEDTNFNQFCKLILDFYKVCRLILVNCAAVTVKVSCSQLV
jgi:hypothetical protein